MAKVTATKGGFKVTHTEDPLTGAPLPDYYEGESKGDHWEMWCKRCNKGWKLTKPREGTQLHPGNLLHLLNHARSHDAK